MIFFFYFFWLKIGPTQQWYDELDNLVFTNQNDESDDPKAESGTEHDDLHSDTNQYDKNMLNIECSVNTSPGTSQVIYVCHCMVLIK